MTALGAFQTKITCEPVALPTLLNGVAVPTGIPQDGHQGHVGGHEGLGVSGLLGDTASLQSHADRPVELAQVRKAGGKDAKRPRFLGTSSNRPRNGECLLAASLGLLGPAAEQQRERVGRERPSLRR